MGDLYAGTATLRFPCLSSLRVFSASDGVGSWRRGKKKKSTRADEVHETSHLILFWGQRQTDTHTHTHTHTRAHAHTQFHTHAPTHPRTHKRARVRTSQTLSRLSPQATNFFIQKSTVCVHTRSNMHAIYVCVRNAPNCDTDHRQCMRIHMYLLRFIL